MQLNTSLVFTFIGADRPGLVEQLAEQVANHGGNWQESRMVELAGQFAGIAKVTLPRDQETALRAAFDTLLKDGLDVTVQSASTPEPASHHLRCQLSIVGNDRPGIVREISRALKQRHINVIEMNSNISSVPMSGEPLFEAMVRAEMPDNTDTRELQDALDDIADQLSLDIVME